MNLALKSFVNAASEITVKEIYEAFGIREKINCKYHGAVFSCCIHVSARFPPHIKRFGNTVTGFIIFEP